MNLHEAISCQCVCFLLSSQLCHSSKKIMTPIWIRRKKAKKCHQPFISYSIGTRGSCGGNKSKSIFTWCVDFKSCVRRRETRSTQTLLSGSNRSEALRLGQRAINLLKCHFRRENGLLRWEGKETDREVEDKISEDK